MRECPTYRGYYANEVGDIISGPKLTRTGFRKLSLFPSARKYLVCGVTVQGKSKQVKVHKLVADAYLGPRPDGKVVDHIDGNILNNAPENLRYVTHRENVVYGRSSTDSSNLVGTTREGNKFKSSKVFGKKRYYLGLFNTEQEAHRAYTECLTVEDAIRMHPSKKTN